MALKLHHKVHRTLIMHRCSRESGERRRSTLPCVSAPLHPCSAYRQICNFIHVANIATHHPLMLWPQVGYLCGNVSWRRSYMSVGTRCTIEKCHRSSSLAVRISWIATHTNSTDNDRPAKFYVLLAHGVVQSAIYSVRQFSEYVVRQH